MVIQVTRVTPAIGVLVEGIDLSRELAQAQIKRLVQHQVLFFRNQPLAT
jgi:alpha-ketoglutarate-dependent taurine dioxygenase